MEKTRYVNLPLAGNIQHGIKTENGFPKELGYFIAKTKDFQMNSLVENFNKLYSNKPTKIKVKFFNEDPFTVRNARYNQSGLVCYCMQGQTKGKQKIKNIWQEKECLETCEYAISNDNQKPACLEEGTLKFLIPEISNDRIWIMKIRGITIIDKLSNYISSQKLLGNSMIGEFYLYLKKEEHIRQLDGQKFTNYTIDILKVENSIKDDLAEITKNQEITPKEEKSTERKSQNIDEKDKQAKRTPKKTNTKSQKDTTETTSKKDNTSNIISMNSKTKIEYDTVKEGEYDVEKCFCYLGIEPVEINNKGRKLNYTLAKFLDSNDKELSAIVNPELANELSSCDLGTIVLIETISNSNYLWITDFKYVQKMLKEAV